MDRNNIIKIFNLDRDSSNTLNLYSLGLPEGITVTDVMRWSGPAAVASVLAFDISPGIVEGKYLIDIGFIINGKDCGTLPCTINVIQ